MSENRIDLDLTQEQVDKVVAAFKTIEETLPGLIELTPEQRQAMPRYSDKDLAFILKAFTLAGQHPEIFPPSFSLDEMRRDVEALQKLDVILHTGHRVIGILEDSRFAAARESQSHGLTVYQFVKTHNALTGKLEDALADLSKHFARAKPAKADKPAES
ncbi:MAG: hypothetical protein ACKN9T_00435 [Candidatus Methylumidiphilus sp.]